MSHFGTRGPSFPRGGPRGGAPRGGFGGPPRGGFGGGYGGPPAGGYGGEYDPYGGYGGGQGGYGGGYGMHPGFPGYPPHEMPSPLDAEIQCVLREIHAELGSLEQSEAGEQFRNARRLLNSEKERLENNIDPEWLEVDIEKPVKVVKKILVPSYRHPQFNFIGKVLGPKGVTLQTLCKTHKCHIYILGRGSTKDREKEAELLASGDPEHAHFGGPLHLKVETVAPSYVAYQRVANVIQELSRILQPINEDTTPPQFKNLKEGGAAAGESGDNDKSEGGAEEEGNEAGNGAGNGNGAGGQRGRGRGGPRGGFGGFGRGGPMRGRGRGGQPPPGYRPY
ncbi:unnamed protein product [Caenorhabditis angaria]|uniref:K Homology domain-containing protein n=1 Tax=Caenorhabditis angaria TaxID=860376 RepID=A0A9P1I4D4_9PELO|nr:unnamed protein product [Caenorhabditis angaria]